MRGKPTFFLDQGETLGGAERFLLDFFQILNDAEIRRLRPIVIGAQNPEYQKQLSKNIPSVDFAFPSVKGGPIKKIVACFKIFFAAKKLKDLAKKHEGIRFFTNTPRTHFVMLIAQKLFRLNGLWVAYFHDFTTRPNFLLRAICRKADFLLVNSLPTRKYLRERIDTALFEKIKIVENGLDLTKIPKAQPSQKIKKILCLGRIDPRKGQHFLVEAAEILQKEKTFHFFIVGDAFSLDTKTVEYEKYIKQQVQTKKLENLYFLPGVKNPFDVILEADLLVVLPSEPETFGRVVIEGLVCGKLVLAFDETGPKEILKAFENFYVSHYKNKPKTNLRIEPKNAESLANKIRFFSENPGLTQKYTTVARPFVEQNFSLQNTKKRLLNILLEQY